MSSSDDGEAGLKWIVKKVGAGISTIIQCGAEDNYLDIAVYFEGQCNVAFEPISELKVPFIISCYENNEDEVLK